MEIDLKPRTTDAVDAHLLQFAFFGNTAKVILDANSPTQRQILECLEQGQLYETATTLVIGDVLKPGDVFFDVGAHVGFFSLVASPLVGPSGRVIAFEPDGTNFAFLKTNVQVNDLQNVTLLNAAVGDFDGQALWDPGKHPFNQRSRATPKAPVIRIVTLD